MNYYYYILLFSRCQFMSKNQKKFNKPICGSDKLLLTRAGS